MDFLLSEHAESAVRERAIKREWINAALNDPDLVLPHETDAAAMHAFKRIEEFGNRVLRVIYNADKDPVVVVTAYFDRAMKGRL